MTATDGERYEYDSPRDALAALLAEIRPVESERVALDTSIGRALADDVVADRDSPACDVSAMDGYALRASECAASLPVRGAVTIGREPAPLEPSTAMRIVTGGAIPRGADAVVKRESAVVRDDAITLAGGAPILPGAHIRRQGENARRGDRVLVAGRVVTPAVVAALASFGIANPCVARRVRVAIVSTGDELLSVAASPTPWSIRDSNGPALAALVGMLPYASLVSCVRCPDDGEPLRAALAESLDRADALVVTGGVSMGERDCVPDALAELGVHRLFHRLPQRPGKPMLAGIAEGGRPVLALPGNPVSVLVTARRYAVAAIRRRAGLPMESRTDVTLAAADATTIPLWWHRLVRVDVDGRAHLIDSRGSGDVASLASSDGFLEVPPNTANAGPWPFYSWCP